VNSKCRLAKKMGKLQKRRPYKVIRGARTGKKSGGKKACGGRRRKKDRLKRIKKEGGGTLLQRIINGVGRINVFGGQQKTDNKKTGGEKVEVGAKRGLEGTACITSCKKQEWGIAPRLIKNRDRKFLEGYWGILECERVRGRKRIWREKNRQTVEGSHYRGKSSAVNTFKSAKERKGQGEKE